MDGFPNLFRIILEGTIISLMSNDSTKGKGGHTLHEKVTDEKNADTKLYIISLFRSITSLLPTNK